METKDPVIETISNHVPNIKRYVLNGDDVFLIRCHCKDWFREAKSNKSARVLFGRHLRAELAKVEDHDGTMFKVLAKDLLDISGRQAPKIIEWPAAMEFITRYGEQET